ncbi:unnamed protein product [Rotaria sp. Silwood2]|nr:unnamed protein product [Rotaria sp. Silwood2]
MPTLQSISELAEEQKTCDRMAQLDIKSNLQLLREQEKVALQSIKKLTEEEMIHIDQWLSVLHKTSEDWVKDEDTQVESRVHVNDIRPIFISKTM